MKILLIGCFGQLGWELHRALLPLGEITAIDFPDIHMEDGNSVRQLVKESSPELIVNASAYTNVDGAEIESELAMAINAHAPGILAEEACRRKIALIHYSTDYVFDGQKNTPYTEMDQPEPLGVYGLSKYQGEEAIRQSGGAFFIFRTSWVYSLRRSSFVTKVLDWASKQALLTIVDDQIANPTWARMLAQATALLIAQRKDDLYPYTKKNAGIYHSAGGGFCSRMDWAQEILVVHGLSEVKLKAGKTKDFPTPAQRPLFSALDCGLFERTFGLRMPDWRESLHLAMDEAGLG